MALDGAGRLHPDRDFVPENETSRSDARTRSSLENSRMTGDNGYHWEWTDDLEVGRTQIRYGLTVERGVPIEFLVQLE